MSTITVLGAGAWGTALAINQAKKGNQVTLWGRDSEYLSKMKTKRENERYLPGIDMPPALKLEPDLVEAVKDAEILLLAVPAQEVSATLAVVRSVLPDQTIVVSCAKGIDRESGRTMSKIIADTVGIERTAILSGPSFAADVARGLPTAVTVAQNKTTSALELCETLSGKQLRCYASDDLIGVDYGGALKNVLAVAAGIADGFGAGASAVAALTTRGFAELERVAMAMGAKRETLSGLSGLGDLILTCASDKSRNFAYGRAIGAGASLENLKLAEGVKTAGIAQKIAAENNIDAPLINAVSDVLEGRKDVASTMESLLSRPIKTETHTS